MENKPNISLCKHDIKNPHGTLGMTDLLTYLEQSGLFEVNYHNDRMGTGKGERGTIIHYNNKKIYLDFWDYAMPTFTMPVLNANFDLIIKLQYSGVSFDHFMATCKSKNMFANMPIDQMQKFYSKIVPWTFFCSRMMKQYIGKSIEKVPLERLGFFCGKGWKCRRWLLKKLEESGIEVARSDQETLRLPLTDDEYIHKMKSSKYGLCIHGRGSAFSEAKNRREIDYMILEKPLLLNYRPHYYNPLVEGKHYIYFDEKIDLKNIENLYNIEEIAKNGREWYLNNATPNAAAKVFKQIMEEKVGS